MSFAAVCELREVEQPFGSLSDQLSREVEVAAVDHQVVEDRELQVEAVFLRYEPDAAPDARTVGGRVHPEHTKRAARKRGHARDHSHRGGLPCSVGTEEPEGFALGDLEVDVVHRQEVTEPLHEVPSHHEGFVGHGCTADVQGCR